MHLLLRLFYGRFMKGRVNDKQFGNLHDCTPNLSNNCSLTKLG